VYYSPLLPLLLLLLLTTPTELERQDMAFVGSLAVVVFGEMARLKVTSVRRVYVCESVGV
jgi:hypothetical protein